MALVAGLGAGAAGALFLYRRHSKRKAEVAAGAAASNDGDNDKATPLTGSSGEYYAPVPQHPVEMEANKPWLHGPAELDPGRHVSELEPGRQLSEVDGGQDRRPSELP